MKNIEKTLSKANTLFDNKEYKEALNLFIKVYNYKEEQQDDENLSTIEMVLNKICTSCLVINEFENTENYFVELYNFTISKYDELNFDTTTAISKLAQYYYKTENYKEAKEYFAQAYKIRVNILGKEDAYTLGTVEWLRATLMNLSNWKEAEQIYSEIPKIRRKLVSADSPVLLNSIHNLAGIYYELEKYTEAEELYIELITQYEKSLELNSTKTINAKLGLSDVYYWNNNSPKAVALLKTMLENYTTEYDNNETTAKIMYKLAENLTYIPNKGREVEYYLKEVIPIYENEIGLNNFKILNVYYDLAICYSERLKDYVEAQKAFNIILERAEESISFDSWLLLNSLFELGKLHYDNFEDSENAMMYFQQALSIISKSDNNNSEKTMKIYYYIANILIDNNDLDRAKPLILKSIESSKLVFGLKHKVTSSFVLLFIQAFPKDSEAQKLALEFRNGNDEENSLTSYVTKSLMTKINTKKVRVFISSTFRDMMPEREYLMKNVFPKLRKLCRNKGYDFTEIDLRWGITEEDAKKGKVIEICLNEIDKSRPFFIGMIGERYGWVPEYEKSSGFKKMLNNYNWLENDIQNGLSVTEMEVQYGVLRNPKMKGNAFFYLRDENLTPEGEGFFETKGSTEHDKLLILKDNLKQQDEYPTEDYSSVEYLGNSIFNNLKQAIFGDEKNENNLSEIDHNRDKQINYVKTYSDFYIHESKVTKTITKFLKFSKRAANKLVVFGEKGSGKTAMLANYIKSHYAENKNKFLFFHFAEADADNKNNFEIVRRIITEINLLQKTDINPDSVNEQNPAPVLEAIFQKVKKEIIIVIDGLEKVKTHEFFSKLFWLPQNIPANIKFIVSTNNKEIFNTLIKNKYQSIIIETLTKKKRKIFINTYLNKFGKKLSEEIINKIVKDEVSEKPLSLKLLLDEVRIFGVFEELNEFIDNYLSANNETELFIKLFERLETDYEEEHQGLVGKALSFIALSKHGLTEGEIIKLTKSATLYWSPIYNSLENYLYRNLGQLSINNEDFTQAVKIKYLNSESKINHYHTELLEYFQNIDDKERKFDELSYHLYKLGEMENLKNHLSDVDVFMLYYANDPMLIIKYWNQLKQEFDIIETYKSVILNYEQKPNVNLAELIEIVNKIGTFVNSVLTGVTENRIFFPKKALQITKKIYSTNHIEIAKARTKLVSAYSNFDDKKAEKHALKALIVFEYNNVRDMKYVSVLSSLSGIYIRQKRFAKAKKLIKNEQECIAKIWKGESLVNCNSLNKLAEISMQKGKYEKAIKYYNESIAIIKRYGGEKNQMIFSILTFLSEIYMEMEMFDKALETVNDSIDIGINVLGENHTSIISSQLMKATILFNLDNLKGAKNILSEYYPKSKSVLGEEHTLTQTYLKLLNKINKNIGGFV